MMHGYEGSIKEIVRVFPGKGVLVAVAGANVA
jgi:hypothetical protein